MQSGEHAGVWSAGLDFFHVGYAVTELEPAMEEIGRATGCTWRPVLGARMAVWTQGGVRQLDLRRVYSFEGPPYIELVQDGAGVWAADGPAGDVHLGFWSSDIQRDAAALEAQGMERTVSDAAPGGGFSRFVYYRSASGPLIELLPVARRDEILNH